MKAEKCACPFTAEADSLQRPVNGYTSGSPTSKLAGVLAGFALLQYPAYSPQFSPQPQSAAGSLASALVAWAIDIRIPTFTGRSHTEAVHRRCTRV